MPYVPSVKTVPPAEDRKILDQAVEVMARETAEAITSNSSLKKVYRNVFIEAAESLRCFLNFLTFDEIQKSFTFRPSAVKLAQAIYNTGAKYGYEGAFLGEFNYAITRFIQRVPQIKVVSGQWQKKDELRYWLYADTTSALVYASRHTEKLDIGVDGVFIDIKDEYKWRVNRAYEAAQIRKSGDCYDTPFYTKLVEVVDERGRVIGYTDVYMERSEETLNQDVLDYEIVLRKRKNS